MAKSFDELVRRTTTPKIRAAAKRRARVLLGEYLLIVTVLGGELEVVARFKGRSVKIGPFGSARARSPRHRAGAEIPVLV